MHIAVCIKQVLDATGPFSLTEEAESLAGVGLVPIANPADMAAVALVRAAMPADATLTALCVGPESAEHVLRTAVAAGADAAVRVWDQQLLGVGGDVTARVLAAVASTLGVDLVVCGSRGLCGGSGYVGPALAEYLGFAQVCSVSRIDFAADERSLVVHRRLDRGDREVVACQLPAVLTVDEGAAEARYAALPAVIEAERREITVMNLASLGLRSADCRPNGGGRFVSYIPPRPRTKRSAAASTPLSAKEQMQQAMMGGGASKKSSNVVEGEPRKAAAEIVKFLVSNEVLVR